MGMTRTIITSYQDPDLDGIACAIGYTELLCALGTTAETRITGTPHPEAHYLLQRYHLPTPPLYTDANRTDLVVLVDVSMRKDIDPKILPEQVVEIIDHRSLHDAKLFPNAKVDIELVGAAATLVTERFRKNNAIPSPTVATLLYAAIVSHTLNLRNRITTNRDQVCAAWLCAIAKPPATLIHDLFVAKSNAAESNLADVIEHDYATRIYNGISIGIAQLEIIKAVNLTTDRKVDILAALEKTKTKQGNDHTFLTALDVEELNNYFVTSDKFLQDLLSKIFNITFDNDIATVPGPYMRKELGPMFERILTKTPPQ